MTANGRPTVQKQLELQQELRIYYERGISATQTARYSDTNVKTVCKYFKQWSQEISEIDTAEFQSRVSEIRSQHLTVLDRQLNELYYLSDSQTHLHNFRDKLSVIKMRLDIMDKKEKLLKDIKNVPKFGKN